MRWATNSSLVFPQECGLAKSWPTLFFSACFVCFSCYLKCCEETRGFSGRPLDTFGVLLSLEFLWKMVRRLNYFSLPEMLRGNQRAFRLPSGHLRGASNFRVGFFMDFLFCCLIANSLKKNFAGYQTFNSALCGSAAPESGNGTICRTLVIGWREKPINRQQVKLLGRQRVSKGGGSSLKHSSATPFGASLPRPFSRGESR